MERRFGEAITLIVIAVRYCFDVENDKAVLRQPVSLSPLRADRLFIVQYQLRAQQMQPNRFVATAAYGDGGPWYIPVKEEYACGGYEVSVAFCDPGVDEILTKGMKALLS